MPEDDGDEGAFPAHWGPASRARADGYRERRKLHEEHFEVGESRPIAPATAFRPVRINVQQPAESPEQPWVCPPVRLCHCPICDAKAGVRCDGFERWDECHLERLLARPETVGLVP